MIKDNDDELMVITMEECGELIQACSKAMRTREYSSQQLTEEVGDVMCMVGLLMQYGLIDEKEVEDRVNVKLAKFAKWRAVITIGENLPSEACIEANAHALARYASLCQEQGIVPIVEPEVLMDGDHGAEECFNKTSEVIKKCYEELIKHKVDLKKMQQTK